MEEAQLLVEFPGHQCRVVVCETQEFLLTPLWVTALVFFPNSVKNYTRQEPLLQVHADLVGIPPVPQ